jgi:hypothetical protein
VYSTGDQQLFHPFYVEEESILDYPNVQTMAKLVRDLASALSSNPTLDIPAKPNL